MAVTWPGSVTKTIEIGSQRGPSYQGDVHNFGDEINAFLKLGWRILNTYVEDRGKESNRDECICLLGWGEESTPRYPARYEDRG
jgi:hypothetical protein